MRGKRVLVTGGFGFIGSNLVIRCLELGAWVTVLDNLDPRCGGNESNLVDVKSALRVIAGDLRNPEHTQAAVTDQDVVFNCAAHTSHPNSLKDPFYDVDVNGVGLLRLLEAVKSHSPGVKFVQVGTSTQIGAMRYSPVTEDHPEFPVDVYSAHKMLGEKYVLIYSRVHGLRATVVRLANVYGPRAHIKTPQFGFVNYFVGLALQQKDLTVYGDGAQLRNLSFVEDCVNALIHAAQNDRSDGEVLFATADRQYSVREIAEHVAMSIGGRVRFVPWPEERRIIEVGDAVISNEKILRLLDWTPHWSLQDGLAATREFYRTRLPCYL